MATKPDPARILPKLLSVGQNEKGKVQPAPKPTDSATKKALNRRKNQKQLQKLFVRKDRLKLKHVKKQKKQHAEDALQNQVNENLLRCAEGEELKVLSRILQPNNNDLYRVYQALEADLTQALNMRRIVYKIHPFGSTISGLAFKDSDFDLYIEMAHCDEPISKIIQILVAAMRNLQQFREIVPIIHARVPIIKCVHSSTGYACDISFSSMFGVYNSQIIRHLVYFDYRIHPLTIILKYWMRTHELSGTGRITNYCLFLLIVFYLQSIPNPILPSFNVFQQRVPVVRVEFWNTAFNFDYANQNRNPSKVADLLKGFFTFYAEYDFQQNIVCSFFGRSYERKNFNAKIPVEFKRYTEYMRQPDAQELSTSRLMCVQDPFNQNYNVASCTGKATFAQFKLELKNAAALCERELASGPESAIFLHKLFNDHAKVDPLQNQPHTVLVTNRNSGPFMCTMHPLEQELFVVRTVLKTQQPERVLEKVDIHRLWVEKFIEFVQDILKRFFLFDLTVVNVEKSESSTSKSQIVLRYSATVEYDVYRNRKQRKFPAADYIELEANASKTLAVANNAINVRCVITITADDEQVLVSFSDETTLNGDAVAPKRKCLKLLFGSFTKTIRHHLRAFFQKYQDDNIKQQVTTEANVSASIESS